MAAHAEIWDPEVEKFRTARPTQALIHQAALGMGNRARTFATDLVETGELLQGLTSYPHPFGDRSARAVSWEHDDYYAYFQNYGWRERTHRIPGRRFLERAFQTYAL